MASDTFNRANETPLAAPWVNAPIFADIDYAANLVSNAMGTSGAGSTALSYYASAATSADQYSEVVALGRDAGAAVRLASGASTYNGYVFSCFGGTAQVLKVANGSYSGVGNTGSTSVAAGTYRVEVSGSSFTSFVNGVQEANVLTDSSFSTGQPGAQPTNSSHQVDSWNGGDLTPPLTGIRPDQTRFPKPVPTDLRRLLPN